MTKELIYFIREKFKNGFSSRQELEFYKLAIQAIEKQMEMEESIKDWREKINPDDPSKEWLLYSLMESFLVEKDTSKISFVSEISKMQEMLQKNTERK